MAQLAQINIAQLKAPIDHPSIADFVNHLEQINTLAENSEGFIWRLKDDVTNNATSLIVYDDPSIIVNISVWENLDFLKAFVYHTKHVQFFIRRNEWFIPMGKAHMALWFIGEDDFPDAKEGKARLEHLQEHGPSPYSFDFKSYDQYVKS